MEGVDAAEQGVVALAAFDGATLKAHAEGVADIVDIPLGASAAEEVVLLLQVVESDGDRIGPICFAGIDNTSLVLLVMGAAAAMHEAGTRDR